MISTDHSIDTSRMPTDDRKTAAAMIGGGEQ
jgi:hypothetical protein